MSSKYFTSQLAKLSLHFTRQAMPTRDGSLCNCREAQCRKRLAGIVAARRQQTRQQVYCIESDCTICHWSKADAVLKVIDWRSLLQLDVIHGKDALVWLTAVGFANPFRVDQIRFKLSEFNMSLTEAETLLMKIKKSSLSAEHQHLYYRICSSLSLYLGGSLERLYHYFELSKKTGFGYNAGELYHFGYYRQSMAVLTESTNESVIEDDRVLEWSIANCFRREQYRETISFCSSFNPFRHCIAMPRDPLICNTIFGIYTFSLLKLGQKSRVQKAMRMAKDELFMYNAIISFCAHELGMQRLKTLPYPHDTWSQNKARYHVDIHLYFRAMIFQYHLKDYQSAICLYHQCNFYGAHPIHLYRLYECYLAIGLYRRASRYLVKSMNRSRGEIPSIKRNWPGKHEEIYLSTSALRCDQCGLECSKLCCTHRLRILPCSGCLKVWYCSKRCQKKAWNRSHRKHCSKAFVGFKQKLKFARQSPLVVS